MVFPIIDYIGKRAIAACNDFGQFFIFYLNTVYTGCTSRLKVTKTIAQMELIGVNSFTIVFLTGSFTGAVLALQSYIGFHRFGAEEFIGPVVAISMARELGPVLTGLMVTGRAGSAITAEIGSMRITEQLDALRTLGIDRYQYLVVPRVVASTLVLPFLSLITTMCGLLGGYLICVHVLELNPEDYVSGIKKYLELSDITGGLWKASAFGMLLATVGCFKGSYTTGGARGVGKATTQSVVVGSIAILIANYFLTALLF